MLACQASKYERPMVESVNSGRGPGASRKAGSSMSLVQRGNLKALETTLRKQWRLGQNIVLCWSADERGLLVILVPHYFLGNYCAQPGQAGSDNEQFVRQLISGLRRKTRDELFAIAQRLDVAPSFVKLDTALAEDPQVLDGVEQLIKRYGLSYVECRGVLLFDIADFSLFTPFEQASQLNSLSYSMNSAYNKLLAQGVEIHFARTTTGDGYYVWNRDEGACANQDLFVFMLSVIADNAVAQAASRGNTVPVLRSAYHAGSHYELYQAEGVNPTVFSYIVGDVTIDLARMVDLAQPNQILLGDFSTWVRSAAGSEEQKVSSPEFVRHCDRQLEVMRGVQLSGKRVVDLACHLSGDDPARERCTARRFKVTDKHGLSRHAYNLQLTIELEDGTIELGIDDTQLPRAGGPGNAAAEDAIDDLASLIRRRPPGALTED